MLNVEKIRLMTKLSMYDKKEGKAIREVSSYFKGDYISRKVFGALVHYTLCFLLLVGLVLVMDTENLLMHLNIPFITAAARVLLFLYVLGLAAMLLFTYVRYARTYDELHRKSLYYMAKLDKLLQMEEADHGAAPAPVAEASPSEKQAVNLTTSANPVTEENVKSTFVSAPASAERNTAWPDDSAGEEEEWLDHPVTPEEGWLDDPVTDEQLLPNETHSSDDGIQLMRIKKKQ
ncbi:MAG TPA: hypothetical protein DD632_02340 [Oribacterium sp.]|nr:hypothetical protein [Oribacterium sp.]